MATIVRSVKIPVNTHMMSDQSLMRLKQIIGRDSRVIYRYLAIIYDNEQQIIRVSKRGKVSIDKVLLDKITLTTQQRTHVKHDMKREFPRISHNELGECRDTAIATFMSYHELLAQNIQVSKPAILKPRHKRGKIPRMMNNRRFRNLDFFDRSIEIIDSMDTQPAAVKAGKAKTRHNWLKLPLKLSQYHEQKIAEGQVVSAHVYKQNHLICISLGIRKDVLPYQSNNPKAIVGIDLGINKAAFVSIITENSIIYRNSFHIAEKREKLEKLTRSIKTLQKARNLKENAGEENKDIIRKLKSLRNKRNRLSIEYDRVLISQILDEVIIPNMQKWDVYVAIGKLKGIRKKHFRGNGNKHHRKAIHKWTYFRITQLLKSKLEELGMEKNLMILDEYWTSSKCYYCQEKGWRKTQAIFVCTNDACPIQYNNADFNGSVNIANRLIAYKSKSWKLVRGTGLARFLLDTATTSRKTHTLGKKPNGSKNTSQKGIRRNVDR